MKIKTIAKSLLILAQSLLASCQEIRNENYEINGEVIHEDGTPVQSARMLSLYIKQASSTPLLGKPTRTEIVETDESGKVTLEFSSLPSPDGGVAFGKNGYYGSTAQAIWKPAGPGSWTAEVKAVLKPIKKPIPMVYHPTIGLRLNAIGVEYPFDLAIGEPLPPYGKGQTHDMTISLEEIKSENEPGGVTAYKSMIRFVNPLDGFAEFPSHPMDGARGSVFVSDYLAPESGYVSTLERIIGSNVRTTSEEWEYIHSLNRIGYYFRIRTKTDSSGKIISANYGKIYGPVKMSASAPVGGPAVASPGKMALSFHEVYLNPSPNDKNVECDTKENLSLNLDRYGKLFPIPRP